jgi:hypothetical protein
MPKLTIPERFRAGVAKIRRLDDRTVQEIRNALDQKRGEVQQKNGNGLEVPRDPNSVAMSAMRSIASVNITEFGQIAESLGQLYAVRLTQDAPIEDFVEDVCNAMESIPEESLRLPHSERGPFKDKLRILLSSQAFAILAKAYDLATEERTFCSSRILTDLRPVFGARVEDGPQAMVVLHTLRLTYHEAHKKHEEFFVVLDADDLKQLGNQIDRAERKAETLRISVKDVRLFGLPAKE